MTAADEPQTQAGKQAAEDKAAAAEKIKRQAEQDQADAEAEARRARTAKARAARAANATVKPGGDRASWAAATIDDDEAGELGAEPCEGCREFQEQVLGRLARVEMQAQAIGKLVATGIVAGAVIWFLAKREQAPAELEG